MKIFLYLIEQRHFNVLRSNVKKHFLLDNVWNLKTQSNKKDDRHFRDTTYTEQSLIGNRIKTAIESRFVNINASY